MLKVFIEYNIKSPERKLFLSLLPQIKILHEKKWDVLKYQVYEGTDQPNLFVEEFLIRNIQEFKDIERFRRTSQDQVWKSFERCLLENREKVNIWSFKTIELV
ncbi:hypothetical protein [Sporosarcina jiandibaonis]|uniref:hypothetical protein n=1 Tax=Sporosarcina jiandibaonis TaxID=2715535 RepID=UPI001557F89C|nr:hypothetical protein [Sporosarcina jiandibaonis]